MSLMKMNKSNNYFSWCIALLTFAVVTGCGKEVPVFKIIEGSEGLVKIYFSEKGDTLAEIGLNADSAYYGTYRLHLNNSDRLIETKLDGNELNGKFQLSSKNGLVFIEGVFLNGNQHLSWLYFESIEDTISLVKELNFLFGQPFGRQIYYSPGESFFEYFLMYDGKSLGWGSGSAEDFKLVEGSLNFYDYVRINDSSEELDFLLFVADVPGKHSVLSILDKVEEEPVVLELTPDGWINGMWFYSGNTIQSKSSLRVKMLDLKVLDAFHKDVYRDFIIFPLVY